MRILQTSLFLLFAVLCQPLSAQEEIPLWGDRTPPYSKKSTQREHISPCWGADCAYQVVTPTLTIYTPTGNGKSNGNAVLVLPGGGGDASVSPRRSRLWSWS